MHMMENRESYALFIIRAERAEKAEKAAPASLLTFLLSHVT